MTDKGGISMNGQPTGGGISMNGESLPVAQATPTTSKTDTGGINMNGAPTATIPSGAAAPTYPMREQEKVGSKCCGCCCDFRRAVIIVDAIFMVLAVVSLATIAIPTSSRQEASDIDDDEVLDLINETYLVTGIISGVGLVALAVPLFGAIKYNVPMIAYGIFWYVASFIANIVVGVITIGKANDIHPDDETVQLPFVNWIVGGIFTCLLIYPHAGLIGEINSGVMSEATYPREEYSCCCGPAGR